MIFQEPMTSLSPLHTIGNQIEEALRIHTALTQARAARRAARTCCGWSGFRDPRSAFDMYPFELSGGHAPARDDRDGADLPARRC